MSTKWNDSLLLHDDEFPHRVLEITLLPGWIAFVAVFHAASLVLAQIFGLFSSWISLLLEQ